MGFRRIVTDSEQLKAARREVVSAADPIETTSAKRSPTLDRAVRLIGRGNCEHAYGLLKNEGSRDPVLVNAKGVCLLRLGRYEEAADLFRNLVLAPGCMWMRKNLPTSYKCNFATALLLSGRPSGCLDILAEIRDDSHATVTALRAAIKRWAQQLSPWQKFNWWVGKIEPANCHPTIDFVPGDFGFDVGLSVPPSHDATAPREQTAL